MVVWLLCEYELLLDPDACVPLPADWPDEISELSSVLMPVETRIAFFEDVLMRLSLQDADPYDDDAATCVAVESVTIIFPSISG